MDLTPISTLSAWQELAEPARLSFLDELAAHLDGSSWQRGGHAVGRHGLGELVHQPTGATFIVVPGGWLRMGLSVDDLFALQMAQSQPDESGRWYRQQITSARPPRIVRMVPFLLARAPAAAVAEIGPDLDPAYGVDMGFEYCMDPADVTESIPEGMRLPSEAELEWALREGGLARFIGVAPGRAMTAENRWDLLSTLENGYGLLGVWNACNLVADGWHDSYVGAPNDAAAWDPEDVPSFGRSGHTYWQDDDHELFGLHAASRSGSQDGGVGRPVVDIPGADAVAVVDGDRPEQAEHATALEALTGDDAVAAGAALRALEWLVIGSAPDAAPVVRAVLAAQDGDESAISNDLLPALLRWLAEVAVGDHFEATVRPAEVSSLDSLPDDRGEALEAVSTGVSWYASLLESASAELRACAALALAFCAARSSDAIAAIEARAESECNATVRLALGLASGRLGAVPAFLGETPAEAAVIALSRFWSGDVDLDALASAAATDPIDGLPFAEGQLANVASGVLAKQGPKGRALAALTTARRIAAMPEGEGTGLAEHALDMLFDAVVGSPPVPDAVSSDGTRRTARPTYRLFRADELSPGQRELMELLGPLPLRLDWERYGLLANAADRRRWLGLDPPGALDQLVAFDDGQQPLWLAFRELQDRACSQSWTPERLAKAQAGVLSALDPLERLAVELERQRYGLNIERWAADRSGHHSAWPAEPGIEEVVDAAVAADAQGARRVIEKAADSSLSGGASGGRLVLVALCRVLDGGELLPPRFDPLVVSTLHGFGFPPHVLERMGTERAEAALLAVLEPLVEEVTTASSFTIHVANTVRGMTPLLAAVPSAAATRALLILGCAFGQPAEGRQLVGRHGGDPAVLAAFDALPDVINWPTARQAMQSLLPLTL